VSVSQAPQPAAGSCRANIGPFRPLACRRRRVDRKAGDLTGFLLARGRRRMTPDALIVPGAGIERAA
jgi:hypothetical protein